MRPHSLYPVPCFLTSTVQLLVRLGSPHRRETNVQRIQRLHQECSPWKTQVDPPLPKSSEKGKQEAMTPPPALCTLPTEAPCPGSLMTYRWKNTVYSQPGPGHFCPFSGHRDTCLKAAKEHYEDSGSLPQDHAGSVSSGVTCFLYIPPVHLHVLRRAEPLATTHLAQCWDGHIHKSLYTPWVGRWEEERGNLCTE